MISGSASRNTEGVCRLCFKAQITCHCLRIACHVRVAVPTLGQIKSTAFLPFLQFSCVELGWRQCTLAHGALIQTVLPRVFRSIAATTRQLRIASLALRHPRHISVPSPHLHAARVKRRACQCFAADDTLHFRVVVSGPASSDAMCFAQYA